MQLGLGSNRLNATPARWLPASNIMDRIRITLVDISNNAFSGARRSHATAHPISTGRMV